MANDITLGDDQPIGNYLKPIKVGGKASPIEMAAAYPDESNNAKVKIDGDLEVTGDLKVEGEGDNIITSFTTGEGVDLKTTEDGGAVLYFGASGGISLSFLANSDTLTIGANQASTSSRGTVQLIDEDDMATDSETRVPTQQSVKAYVDTEVADLVNSAPAALDTLDELAAALNDDASFSTTVTNSIATKLPLAGGDMTGHLQITASDGSHSGGGSYVPSGSDWQNVLRLGSTSDNGLNILVNDGGTMKTSYYTNRWGCQHEWARGSQDTGDGNTYQPAMRLTSSDSTNILYLYDGTTNATNIRLSAESSNDTYFNNSDSDVAIGSTSAGGYKLHVTGTTHITGALTVDSTVDGRDLATDGSKLDGIEDNATADQTQADINGLAITTTGALDSGSITSGFGTINNGSSSITTTGAISGGSVSSDGTLAGKNLALSPDALTSSSSANDVIRVAQVLNAGSGENSGMIIENFSMFKSSITDTDSAGWDNVYHINCLTGVSSKFTVNKDGNVTAAGNMYLANDKNLYFGAAANNDYIYSDGSQINVALDDSDIIQFRDAQVRSEVPILIQEAASATTDVAGKGQLWVKNDTPNNLYFTNDAGNDVQITNGSSLAGGGSSSSEFRYLAQGGFNYSSTAPAKVYLPLNGYIIEFSFSSNATEYQSFVAPYDGYLNQVIMRSEEACGSSTVGFHKSSDGTEVPNSTASASVVVDMAADDTAYKFAFSSSNTFSAGDIINISFAPTNDANDTVFTCEFVLDSSSGL